MEGIYFIIYCVILSPPFLYRSITFHGKAFYNMNKMPAKLYYLVAMVNVEIYFKRMNLLTYSPFIYALLDEEKNASFCGRVQWNLVSIAIFLFSKQKKTKYKIAWIELNYIKHFINRRILSFSICYGYHHQVIELNMKKSLFTIERQKLLKNRVIIFQFLKFNGMLSAIFSLKISLIFLFWAQ